MSGIEVASGELVKGLAGHASGSNSAVMPGSDAETLQRMTEAAMKRAVELGVMWKYVAEEQYLKNWDNMREIVEAALLAK